ncbi:MAG TPA: hypothetical protein VHX63_00845 [Acidobacteriaceae bacterium]|jgi:hypothetical protein|nr:hypothetical protein [Acidobacteriaceae bacterium]
MATRIGTILAATLLLGTPAVLLCQQNGSTPQQSSTSDSSSSSSSAPAKGNSSASDKKQQPAGKDASSTTSKQPPATANSSAFPEAQSEAAAKPRAQETPAKPNSTATDNPFPEAQSAAAAKADDTDKPSPASNQPLKLSPPPGVSSSDANLPPEDLGESTPKHEHEDEFTKDLNPAGRVENDLKVANFYVSTGDYRGADLRYQDVLQYDASNEGALFGMAYIACKQNRSADALAQMKAYLQQYPGGSHSKEAQKILRDPKKCTGNH